MRASFASRCRSLLLLALAGTVGACSGGPSDTTSGPPATVEAATMSSVNGTAAAAVSPAPSVTVRDQSGRPVQGVLVHWRIVSGGGRVANDTSRTNASGVATSGGWTLGSTVGTQELEALVSSVGTVRFTAQAETGPVSRLVRLTPDPQFGVVGQPVPLPPSVRAEDAFGNPLPGVDVMFAVVSGSGTIAGVQKTTNGSGVATADSWVLGPTRGQQLARAIATGGASVTFSATAAPDVPVAIEIVSGNNQQGLSGLPLPQPVVVRLRDKFSNPVPNVLVVATPAPNSGTVAPTTAVTNDNGLASFVWTLGSEGEQRLTISSASVPGVTAIFAATLSASQFNIVVRYVDFTPSARQQLAVQRAVEKFRNIIMENSGVAQANFPAASCGRSWMPAVNEVISGMLIFARIGFIDGTSGSPNVVGNANVCALHPGSGLPAIGTLLLDSDDLGALEANGLVDAVVLHEMGHTLGIGVLWEPFITGSSSDPGFSGAAARARFLDIGGENYTGTRVPVEIGRGPGSDSSHWRESVMGREIMTSQLNSGFNPLSVVTIGSLEDIGYVVSYAEADAYQLPSAAAALMLAGPSVHLHHDVLRMPPLPPGAWIREIAPATQRRR